ncbi:hypothetical protein KBC03_06295 [Patescibacteria group bacterium]|nr:hypothetical protein [Patescibacteria group bacterium]
MYNFVYLVYISSLPASTLSVPIVGSTLLEKDIVYSGVEEDPLDFFTDEFSVTDLKSDGSGISFSDRS